MKVKLFFTLLVAGVLGASAQGYQDGVDNYNAGRLDVAKTILGNTINGLSSTNKAEAYFYLGNIDFSEGNVAQAKANYEKGEAADATYPYNLVGLGKVELLNGNKSQAEADFKRAQEINKKDTKVMVAIARAYYEVNPVTYAKEIDKQMNKALKDSKNTESAVFLLQGDMKAKENPGDAAALYELAIESDKGKNIVNREAYVKYANTYFKVAPSFAIDKLKELNKLEPNSALAQRELAEKYYDNDQFGSACQQYGIYMQNPNHFQSDEQRYAGLLFSAKEYDKSLELAEKVLAKDPKNYFMYRLIMMNKEAVGDYPATVEWGEKLFSHADAKLTPTDYILYGNALSNEGNVAKAVEVYEKAIELNPDKPELLVDLSAIYEKNGQNEEAVATMKRYLDGGNGKVNDFVKMAQRYDGLARSLEADTPERAAAAAEGVKYIDMAVAKAPNTPIVYAIKAQILLTGANNVPNADVVATYEKMLDLLNADPANREKSKSLYIAGDYFCGIYYMDHDKEKAKQYLTDYTVLRPGDEKVEFILETLNK
ncbi:MAG: tetratricopeptide repeat protein [Muribaculaceae bacterium]|nr:tetratricopeptide repeat protein [Muribaculaceae bacterium]